MKFNNKINFRVLIVQSSIMIPNYMSYLEIKSQDDLSKIEHIEFVRNLNLEGLNPGTYNFNIKNNIVKVGQNFIDNLIEVGIFKNFYLLILEH